MGRKRRLVVLVLVVGGVAVWRSRSRRAVALDPPLRETPALPPRSEAPVRPPVAQHAFDAPAAAGRSEPDAAEPVPEPAVAPAASRPSPRPRARSAGTRPPPGAGVPQPDGSAPGPDFTIKGNAGSQLFHGPDSPYYGRTKAEYWFRTPDDARAAGFTEWTPKKRATS